MSNVQMKLLKWTKNNLYFVQSKKSHVKRKYISTKMYINKSSIKTLTMLLPFLGFFARLKNVNIIVDLTHYLCPEPWVRNVEIFIRIE